MLQKLPGNNFEWIEGTSQFNEDARKSYNEEGDEGYFLEANVQYPEKIHEIHNDLPFLPEKIKIEKVGKLITNLYDNTVYVIHIRNLNPQPYIAMNTKQREKAKNNFEKVLFKLVNAGNAVNAVFRKTMKNERKHKNIKPATRVKRRNYIVLEPNFHTTKFYTKIYQQQKYEKNSSLFFLGL